MNWEALGAIAEAMGAVGVIATLAYLSIQLRQNAISARPSKRAASRCSHIHVAPSERFLAESLRRMTIA
jgi:hypothetical protein